MPSSTNSVSGSPLIIPEELHPHTHAAPSGPRMPPPDSPSTKVGAGGASKAAAAKLFKAYKELQKNSSATSSHDKVPHETAAPQPSTASQPPLHAENSQSSRPTVPPGLPPLPPNPVQAQAELYARQMQMQYDQQNLQMKHNMDMQMKQMEMQWQMQSLQMFQQTLNKASENGAHFSQDEIKTLCEMYQDPNRQGEAIKLMVDKMVDGTYKKIVMNQVTHDAEAFAKAHEKMNSAAIAAIG